MMTVLSLMTAVYWGQLAGCEVVQYAVAQYSCSQKAGYSALAAFSSLLFIVQLVFTAAVAKYRAELIDEVGLYDEISGSNTSAPHPLLSGAAPYEPSKGSFSHPSSSADL